MGKKHVETLDFMASPIVYNHAETEEEVESSIENNFIGRIDFPIVDIYFHEEDTWLFVIYSLTDDSYKIIDDRELLQRNKEFISITTFPIGRGTTPSDIISIYKNGDLYKDVQGWEIKFYSKELSKAVKDITKSALSKKLNKGVFPGI